MENGDEEQITDQLNSRVTISLLQEAFLGQVTQSHSQYHRQLRLHFSHPFQRNGGFSRFLETIFSLFVR